VDAARTFARAQDVTIEPRKLWPSGGPRKGRIAGCSEGRALAFADDPGWAEALLPLFATVDGPASEPVLKGMVDVLARWRRSWSERPVAVVPMPSSTHPELTGSLARHVAAVGRLPLLEVLRLRGPLPDADDASGSKVKALFSALSVESGAEVPAGPLLLVGATYRSGWSMTVAAALLRDAGASAVLPLVLHRLP
jgi:ATP-dependent DNA helicase RecQ